MKRSGFAVMARLVGLVRPLAGYMALAVTMGLTGHLCATFLTVLGGYGILGVLGAGSALPLAGLAVAAAVLAVPLAVSRASGPDGLRLRNEVGALAGFVLDSLRGLPEILQYGAGAARLQQMQDRTEALSRREERLKRTAGRGTAATQLILWGFDLAMLFAATALYLRGAVDFAGVVLPTLALMSSFGPVVALASLGATLQNTFAAGNRVLDLLEEEPLTRDIHGQPDVTFAGAGAEKVTFGYGEGTILRDVTVPVPAGQTIGIVGKSGSGKSTLLKLFLRFWQVEQGRVQLSGRSVEAINTKNLRRMQALVTQETHLFRDSIRNNLLIARPDATDAQLVEACKKASVHDFIAALPQGYDTPVGELGDTLSGGERQRLGLARAFLHDAPFLLLDEPTSNLDSLNEAVILRALEQEHGNRTVVLVSHRASTMGIADTVYSVENGRVS